MRKGTKRPARGKRLVCLRCGHEWGSTLAAIGYSPMQCPKCHSVVWDKPRADKEKAGAT